MDHTEPEPEPSARLLPLLLIVGALLTAGLLCSDALDRLAPAPGQAEPGIQPGIALVVETDRAPAADTTEPVPVVEPAAQPTTSQPDPMAPVPMAPVETASTDPDPVEVAPDTAQSNGNTNPNANPNGHTNHAATGAGQNGHGQGGKP